MKTPPRATAGHAALGALMVVVALGAVTTVGLSARTRDLGFEARSLRQHQARWAAESGVARARLRRARRRGVEVQGKLPAHDVCDAIAYSTSAEGSDRIVAVGRCSRRGRPDALARIEVELEGPGRGRVRVWREGMASVPTQP